jgi:hypothetical protein
MISEPYQVCDFTTLATVCVCSPITNASRVYFARAVECAEWIYICGRVCICVQLCSAAAALMRNQTEIILEIGKLRKVPLAGTFGSVRGCSRPDICTLGTNEVTSVH